LSGELQWERIGYLIREARLTRRELLRLVEGVTATSAFAAVAAACGDGSSAERAPLVPTLDESFPYCLPDTTSHVYRPERLTHVAECVSISGIARSAKYNPYDGDSKVLVEPDPQYRHLLAASNNGLLVVEVIPTDEPKVYIPNVGEHATFYGPMVLDRGHDHWVEIHPCWLITTQEIQGQLTPRNTLDVHVDAPEAVPVGQQLHIPVSAESTAFGARRSVSQAHIFIELVSAQGVMLDWAAGSTNTLGNVTLSLVSLVHAADYTLRVFATKGSDTGLIEVPIRSTRR
jgi:hypothetical protein